MSQLSTILQCPDCCRVITFADEQTNLLVCHSCGSVVYRSVQGRLEAKPQFILAANPGIIQPGTTGRWEEQEFTVLGRFRAWFEESVFNYWTIRFTNGDWAWLTEGYGIYGIAKPVPLAESLSLTILNNLSPGDTRELIPDHKYVLHKKQKTIKWEIEGELYIPSPASSFRVWDFAANKSKHLSVFEFDGEPTVLDITYTSFASLQLANLREYEAAGKTFPCKHCDLPVQVNTYPYAQSCACAACGTFYSLRNGLDFIEEKSDKPDDYVHLPLGSKGEVMGIAYEVIGYAQKEEQKIYQSKWREYTLYNPQEGFAFLSEYEGHWIYVRETNKAPFIINQNERFFKVNGEPFHLYNAYNYEVINARGEFPYNVFDNGKTKVREYISPPEVWIQERDEQEGITWFLGQHLPAKTVEQSFHPPVMPVQKGIGAVQPTGYMSRQKIFLTTGIAFAILLFVHLLISFTRKETVLMESSYIFPDSLDQVSVVTPKFDLNKWRSNLQFAIWAPVRDSWFELGATLVNAETGKEYSIEQGVEYYSGYSEGEYWSEGSTSKKAWLTKIPAGTYFLQLQGTRENNLNKIPEFSVGVTYDVPMHRNLLIPAILLIVWALGKYLWISYNEQKRWSNSPYSPFES